MKNFGRFFVHFVLHKQKRYEKNDIYTSRYRYLFFMQYPKKQCLFKF